LRIVARRKGKRKDYPHLPGKREKGGVPYLPIMIGKIGMVEERKKGVFKTIPSCKKKKGIEAGVFVDSFWTTRGGKPESEPIIPFKGKKKEGGEGGTLIF